MPGNGDHGSNPFRQYEYLPYVWDCPFCGTIIRKDTPQGLGMAKNNHLRKHGYHGDNKDYPAWRDSAKGR